MINIISLGAGRQSTAMALMAAHGEITPMPDAAIMADTGDEPAWVYETMRWLRSGNVLPYPVIVTSAGCLSDALLAGNDEARIPAFIKGSGISTRQCTRNFKIRPIRRAVREFIGVGPHDHIDPGAVSQWIGISRDEAHRMKPSGVNFIVNRWPLIEKGLSVADCERWLKRHDYQVPWSSHCVECPFISNALRRRIRDNDPHGWAKSIRIDHELRSPANVERFRGELYVHPSMVPLDEADLADGGDSRQGNLFGNECEGMCGV
jgi:hypothetical protein